MYRKKIDRIIKEFIKFRSNMGVKLTLKKARYIWGKERVSQLPKGIFNLLGKKINLKQERVILSKIRIAKRNMDILLVSDWVKFIGVSGSVAAGFAKEEDDIDLFIVVRNGSAWIYRGIIRLRNLFKHVIRVKRDGENVKNLFCTNYIVEERGLSLERDIFNLHELMYMIPIYQKRYLSSIFSENRWLETEYLVDKGLFNSKRRVYRGVNIFIVILNYLAYLLQVLFMLISNHKPEIKRIQTNYSEGRIQFFPSDYKERILKGFYK